jgi:DNA-binding NarL/FixJ family response regulator
MNDRQVPRRARLLLADDHAMLRAGLVRLLEDHAGIEIVGEAADGTELLALAIAYQPELILTDLSMPGPSGLELVRALAGNCPESRVLVLTMHKDAALASHAMAAGAAGYLGKDNAYPVLQLALERLLRGGRFIDPDLAEEMMAGAGGGSRAPHQALSRREFEVLEMIAAGRALKEIGYALHISPKTVTSHKRRVMDKLGVHSTADLIRYTVSTRLAPA